MLLEIEQFRGSKAGPKLPELALFNLGIDSKLRGCDLVSLKVRDICHGDQVPPVP